MEVPRGELAGVVDLCDVARGRKGWVRRGGARASPRRSRRAFGAKRKRSRAVRIARRCS